MKQTFDAHSPLNLSADEIATWLETLRTEGCFVVRNDGVDDLIWRIGPDSARLADIHKVLICELRSIVREHAIAEMAA